jgi:hypothetical protein
MRRAFEQHLDCGKNRPVVVNDENARHGVPLRISFVQLKVTYFPISAKVEAGQARDNLRPHGAISNAIRFPESAFCGIGKICGRMQNAPADRGVKMQPIVEGNYEPFGLISV